MTAPSSPRAHWWMSPKKEPLMAVCQQCGTKIRLADVEAKTGYFYPSDTYGGPCKGKNEGELPGMVEI